MRTSAVPSARRVAIVLLALVVAMTGDCATDEAGSGGAARNAAAGRAATSEDANPLPEPCDLFSEDEVRATFGDVGPGMTTGGGGRRVCLYDPGPTVAVTDARMWTAMVSALSESECHGVTGTGDEAFFCVTTATVGELLWRQGGVMYDITATNTDEATFVGLASTLR